MFEHNSLLVNSVKHYWLMVGHQHTNDRSINIPHISPNELKSITDSDACLRLRTAPHSGGVRHSGGQG